MLAPIVVTAYLLWLLVDLVGGVVRPLARRLGLPGLVGELAFAADLLAAGVVVVGLLAQPRVGRTVMGGMGRVVNVLPLVATVYRTIRSVADALVERESRHEKVVLVEFPREEVYSIGLVTGQTDAFETVEPELATVFFPNGPNPTGGRLALVPEDAIREVDVSVRHGLRPLVTTGIGAATEPARVTAEADGDATAERAGSQIVPVSNRSDGPTEL